MLLLKKVAFFLWHTIFMPIFTLDLRKDQAYSFRPENENFYY